MATTAAKKSAAAGTPVVEKRKLVFTKVDQLKPGTQNHTFTVKAICLSTVLQKPRSAVVLNSSPTCIAECLIGDEIGTIVFIAHNEQSMLLDVEEARASL